MAARSFLILHGLQGSGPGHWQTWLAARLRANAERVAYPDLPDADMPSLPAWRGALDGELASLPGSAIVVCHSLACLLWLHHVAEGGTPAERVLLVAPPSERSGVAEIQGFFPVPLPALTGARLVCSDNDPYCPEGAAGLYGEPLDIPVDLIRGRGHLNPEAGFGPWPAVEAWCVDGDRPITP
jgi:predicted alpha/beta hydrolase family esterase